MTANYWLLKSEPDVYSILDLKRDKKTLWEGVRNYQARNFMMQSMQPGDLAFFYHSNAEPTGVAGLIKIARVNLPDPSALDKKSEYFDPKAAKDHPIWFCCEVEFIEAFAEVIELSALKKISGLEKMPLLQRGQRLSVQPVAAAEFQIIMKLAVKSKDAKSKPKVKK